MMPSPKVRIPAVVRLVFAGNGCWSVPQTSKPIAVYQLSLAVGAVEDAEARWTASLRE